MKVYYSRVNTEEQNAERQLQELNGFDYIFTIPALGALNFLSGTGS